MTPDDVEGPETEELAPGSYAGTYAEAPRTVVDKGGVEKLPPRSGAAAYRDVSAKAGRGVARDKDGTVLPAPAEEELGAPSAMRANFAQLGALSSGGEARDEMRGYQRFADFMKEVKGIPYEGAPGFKPYKPLTADELGVIAQMIGVDPAKLGVFEKDGTRTYSDETRARVEELSRIAEEFQGANGLTADGVIGVRTGPAMASTSVLDNTFKTRPAVKEPAPAVEPPAKEVEAPVEAPVDAKKFAPRAIPADAEAKPAGFPPRAVPPV